ncbi:MAG: UDP-N-acetylmuramoyl-L-alanyl-D-glutamate--2,6-diaminopimelate ligase [Cyclobacteriaceae bacterium]|nr:UDP-N-acetylmuramoyl-L-alanyl-D-glutamate--2,6-diaminopimelate ligase [Cyclobacteriaceae bacterium]
MKLLKDILYKVSLTATSGDMNIPVASVHFDSRKVAKGDVFVAVAGTQVDGHQFIQKAIAQGAVAIVCEHAMDAQPGVAVVQTESSSKALGIIASNYYENPSSKLKLIAVTGTNGKTTTVTLLFHLFRKLGYNAGLLSTILNKINDESLPSTHTTGDALQINQLLRSMVDAGCTHCFMEASSHAIDQNRIAGLAIDVAVFSNITHDHLDYHHTFDEYIKAKKKLFDSLTPGAFALVNIDDKRGSIMLQNTRAEKRTFGIQTMADFKARVISNSLTGLELDIDNFKIWFNLIGKFNAYNLVAAYGVGVLLEEDPQEVLTALSSLPPVPGRFERVPLKSKVIAIIDYAHTPDALDNVLKTIESIRTRNEQVITVTGCGGNRDKEKRPLMAEIACKLSDRVIFTSDNPRDEDPEVIIDDMKRGVRPSDYRKTLTIVDRKEAIKTALALAKDEDIILIAGKGHEDYQEIKGIKNHFSDKETLLKLDILMSNDQKGKG